AARPRLRPGCRAWAYLAEERRVPRAVLELAGQQDVVRDGAYGSAWFAHRDGGVVTHVEIRGPTFKGSLRGGDKALFRVRPGRGEAARLRTAPVSAPPIACDRSRGWPSPGPARCSSGPTPCQSSRLKRLSRHACCQCAGTW